VESTIKVSAHFMRRVLEMREELAKIGTVAECAAFDKKVGAVALACILTPMEHR
jgi:hypothetical protein